jgi:antitoxin ParD1/3/4
MATMNVSLPDAMKAWVEAQSRDGRFSNSSDYIRALIRREQVKADKIAHWNRLIEEAEASGISDETVDEIFERARAHVAKRAAA